MASEEIGEINSSNPEVSNSSSCKIQVGYELMMNEEDIPDVSSARIFRVPHPLRDSNDGLYSPHLVSIGPFHYGKEKLKALEESKSEAVRRMQKRIQRNDPDASIKSIVEGVILLKHEKIREFYSEQIPFTSEALAWMVARDACFVFEFLTNYVRTGKSAKNFYREEVSVFNWKYDAIFDAGFQNPLRERIMNDILLFENQIPLWVLKDIFQIQKLDFLMELLLAHAVRHKVFMWKVTHIYNECSHVLEVVYHGMIGHNVNDFRNSEALQLLSSSRSPMQIWFKKGLDPMKAICRRWCKLCLHFPSSNTSRGKARQTPSSLPNRKQSWFRNAVDSMKAICGCWCNTCLRLPSSNKSPRKEIKLEILKLPTALELTRTGVKIHPVLGEDPRRPKDCPAIRWIRFDEKTSTLYLPQMKITVHSDLVMRNIIAMEVTTKWRYSEARPMTQFAMFMDELIDSKEDVDVLRKAGVINNFLGSNEQVANHLNSLTKGITLSKGCKVIDEARRGLHNYTRRKYKILWSEFLSAYFSKPWLVAGSMAAVLLLLMTVAQVFCLFFTCNP